MTVNRSLQLIRCIRQHHCFQKDVLEPFAPCSPEPPVASAIMFDEDVASPGNTKKTRLDSIEKTKLDRRLVEYFVVVSANVVKRDSSSSRKQKQVEWLEDNEFGVPFRPFISARYPLHDHSDNPLHENVTFFCHPSGGIQVRANEELPKVRRRSFC
jgi:hypothetical protein